MKNLFRAVSPWLVCTVLFLTGIALGWLLGVYKGGFINNETLVPLRSAIREFKFINPLVGFENLNESNSVDFTQIKNKIADFVQQKINDNTITDAGIYVRHLNDGRWFGVNENKKFIPGSLLKVPLMMAYLKESEDEKDLLSKFLYFPGHDAKAKLPLVVTLSSALIAGHGYTVSELINSMIIKSDNDAKDVLLANVNEKYFSDVFKDLNESVPDVRNYEISPKAYASFFRRLYNATYLNRANSEYALNLMTKIEFNSGLDIPLPDKTIPIAHKFGERGVYDQNNNLIGAELHDCGIIYLPGNPYFICVMTKGYRVPELDAIIQNISKIVYEYEEVH